MKEGMHPVEDVYPGKFDAQVRDRIFVFHQHLDDKYEPLDYMIEVEGASYFFIHWDYELLDGSEHELTHDGGPELNQASNSLYEKIKEA